MEKKCGGDYPVWGFEQTVANVSPVQPIANPFCEGCDYINACAARVGFALLWEELPETAFEIIALPPDMFDQLKLDITKADEGL